MSLLNKLFLQGIISSKVLNEDAIKKLHQKCCQKLNLQTQDFNEFLGNINKSLLEFSLEIKNMRTPDTGKLFFALTNTLSDEVAQFATDYSHNEFDFFKFTLGSIVASKNFKVPSTELLRYTRGKSHISKTDAELMLERMCKEYWLDDMRGIITLGIRSLLELQTYIKEEFGELPECTICHDIATVKVEYCQRSNCATTIHINCREVLFRTASKNCPSCSKEWIIGPENSKIAPKPREILISDREVSDVQNMEEIQTIENIMMALNRETDNEDEEEDDDEDTEVVQGSSSTNLKHQRTISKEDDESEEEELLINKRRR
ncbi:hypothetical protein HDU92_001442 [Lobulomyces angularis]|nr:hypothetical protein HDU92_001442 [Lobulomyces angularis]